MEKKTFSIKVVKEVIFELEADSESSEEELLVRIKHGEGREVTSHITDECSVGEWGEDDDDDDAWNQYEVVVELILNEPYRKTYSVWAVSADAAMGDAECMLLEDVEGWDDDILCDAEVRSIKKYPSK